MKKKKVWIIGILIDLVYYVFLSELAWLEPDLLIKSSL